MGEQIQHATGVLPWEGLDSNDPEPGELPVHQSPIDLRVTGRGFVQFSSYSAVTLCIFSSWLLRPGLFVSEDTGFWRRQGNARFSVNLMANLYDSLNKPSLMKAVFVLSPVTGERGDKKQHKPTIIVQIYEIRKD